LTADRLHWVLRGERSKLKRYDNDIIIALSQAYKSATGKLTANFIRAISYCIWTLYA